MPSEKYFLPILFVESYINYKVPHKSNFQIYIMYIYEYKKNKPLDVWTFLFNYLNWILVDFVMKAEGSLRVHEMSMYCGIINDLLKWK